MPLFFPTGLKGGETLRRRVTACSTTVISIYHEKKKKRQLALFSYAPALFVIVKQKNSCVVPSQRELECTHPSVCLQAYLGSLAEWAAVFHVIVLYALSVSAEVMKRRKVTVPPYMVVLRACENQGPQYEALAQEKEKTGKGRTSEGRTNHA